IKFQTFKAEELLLKTTAKVEYQKEKTDKNENFYEMIKRYEFTKDEFHILADYCNEKGIIFLSTPFDPLSVHWLEELNVPAYKVGSGDMNNFPLLKEICSKKKPIFISTGMATLDEVKETINYIKSNEINEIVLFQCTTNYPTSFDEVNLNVIDTYKKEFPDLLIGFSDHSLGITVSLGAVAKGVKVIEKHFTLDKEMEGPDHKASLDPKELKQWVYEIRHLEMALGDSKKNPMKSELEIAKVARKSIVTIKDIKAGDTLTEENIAVKRPGVGIPPKEFYEILGKKVKKHISKDSILQREDIYE
ncbi:MAG: N-acetylneuraminate synthase family protein, partial [Promethearchaeota archaeon]